MSSMGRDCDRSVGISTALTYSRRRWFGILSLVGGEVGNLVAYGYAPAAVVTPMGASAVVTNVFITTYILKEPFRWTNFAGAVCVIIGIVLVVMFAPMTVMNITSERLWEDVIWTMEGGVYLALLVGSFIIMHFVSNKKDKNGKKWGERTVVIYISQCAIVSTVTIVCAKTFSSMLTNSIRGGFETEFFHPAPYIVLILMCISCCVATWYVNAAMMVFGNSKVVPTYFALFTTTSVTTVAFVYHEFDCMKDLKNGLLFLFGILITMAGVFLVQQGADQKKGRVAPSDDKEDSDGVKADGSGALDSEHERDPGGSTPGAPRTASGEVKSGSSAGGLLVGGDKGEVVAPPLTALAEGSPQPGRLPSAVRAEPQLMSGENWISSPDGSGAPPGAGASEAASVEKPRKRLAKLKPLPNRSPEPEAPPNPAGPEANR